VESVQTAEELAGALAIVGASASYGLSTFMVKNRYAGMPSLSTSCVSVTGGAVLSLPLAIATAPSEVPGWRPIMAVVVLGLVGTALAFVLFYVLIAETGAGRAALVGYLIPPVALAYGAALLDERITLAAIAGLTLILAGVALASRRRVVEPSEGPRPAGTT
jgi:drug/metabolite transporter (DMT)-like permease